MDTVTDGRLDIVIFPNGGYEYIGKLAASPEVNEEYYLPFIARFVEDHQGLEVPTKYTATYRVKNDNLEISWGDYAGEIPSSARMGIELNGLSDIQ